MIIRPFEPADATALAEIISRDLVEVNSTDYPEKIITSMIGQYSPKALSELAQKRDMFVAENDGGVVGTVSLEGRTVYTLFVDPKVHGSGIGSALMEHVEKLAKERGISSVIVPASLTAHDFYLNRGYVEVRKAYDDGLLTGIIMQKELLI